VTHLFGRAAPGQRVVEATPGDSGAHCTLVAAPGLEGANAGEGQRNPLGVRPGEVK